MKAKMLNQLFQKGKVRTELTQTERKSSKELDKDIWSTVYITDMPIQILTETAYSRINVFLARTLESSDIKEFSIERNGMLGFWQFTVMTYKEVTKFDITDEVDDKTKQEYENMAYHWLKTTGYDKYGDDIEIRDLQFRKNLIQITLANENSGFTVIMKQDESSGKWKYHPVEVTD